MKFSKLLKAAACGVLVCGLTVQAPEVKAEGAGSAGVPMYRLYNPNSGEHFYTKSVGERDSLRKAGWRYESVGWVAPASSNTPVYRLYNANAGDHHYTPNNAEKDMLVSQGWQFEGVGWYSDDNHTVVVYREYSPHAKAGAHNYTTSKSENDSLCSNGWNYEGVAWYALEPGYGDSEADTNTSAEQPSGTLASVKVDVNVTGVGGQEVPNPGSYRTLYSNLPFDNASLSGAATIEYSADVQLNGNSTDYGVQLVIAGLHPSDGQVGVELHYQAGSDARYGQGRINTTTINFPANAGTTGQQYYSVNTSAPAVANGQTAHLDVKYFDDEGMVQTFVNGTLVGQYRTVLNTSSFYILHAHMDDQPTGSSTVNIMNMNVLRNGQSAIGNGAPEFPALSTTLSRGQNISGAY